MGTVRKYARGAAGNAEDPARERDQDVRKFEPTIEPRESLALIERTLRDNSVDHYKIGKINHFKNADGWQDWRQYLLDCLALLRPTGKEVYYKFCLRKFAPDVELTPEEKDPDAYIVRVLPSEQLKLF